MTAMNRRELIKKTLAGTAVVAVGMSVMPRAIEAAPLAAGRTLPPEATEEFVLQVHPHWRRRRRRRRRWRRYWRRHYWDCWWYRGYRVCDW